MFRVFRISHCTGCFTRFDTVPLVTVHYYNIQMMVHKGGLMEKSACLKVASEIHKYMLFQTSLHLLFC